MIAITATVLIISCNLIVSHLGAKNQVINSIRFNNKDMDCVECQGVAEVDCGALTVDEARQKISELTFETGGKSFGNYQPTTEKDNPVFKVRICCSRIVWGDAKVYGSCLKEILGSSVKITGCQHGEG